MKAVGQRFDASSYTQEGAASDSMGILTPLGRFFIAVAMVVFGLQHFFYLEFVTRVFPKLPPWIPGRSALAVVFGAILVLAGLAMMSLRTARLAALLLGSLILISFALLYLPALITTPPNGGLWTAAGKGLALAGSCFLVAGSLPLKLDGPARSLGGVAKTLEKLIPAGRYLLAAFLILGGIEHFIYVPFVASLVPSWIPGHIFWTYFAGVALIAGGVGMCVGPTTRLAGFLSGLMIFLWVILLHIPRAMADIHHSNETTAVFEALAFSGAAFLVATMSKTRE
jgi:uncharacterized membrane protein